MQNDNSLVCACGNDIFVTYGDNFGFTVIQCKNCDNRISIVESSLIAEKLLSAYGEDYCKAYGKNDKIEYLVFTEFETKVVISIADRKNRIKLAKDEAVKNQWYERAARLRDEERKIYLILQQQNKFLML